MRVERMRSSVWVAVCLLLSLALACNGDSGPTDGGTQTDSGGLRCGTKTCATGQVCCLDCDGTGSCVAPGSPCPGLACPQPRDGGADGPLGDAGSNPCGDRPGVNQLFSPSGVVA